MSPYTWARQGDPSSATSHLASLDALLSTASVPHPDPFTERCWPGMGSLPTWLPAAPLFQRGPQHPSGGGGGRNAAGQGEGLRDYHATSKATSEQLLFPTGYLVLIAQPGPNQGTRSRHCLEEEERK